MRKIVTIQNVSVSCNGFSILENITCDIFEHEILFIIGPNGAGKTTLLKVILGLQKQSGGTIRILDKRNITELVAETCGYVPQYSDIERNFPISVSEVISLNTHGPGEHEKIQTVLDKVHMAKFAQRKLSSLSGGEFQKMLIARSIAGNPKILFLDEPTNNLDVEASLSLFSLLKKLKEDGLTIVVVSHDINIVSSIGDRVICLNRVLGCSGIPSQVLSKEILESVYGRSLSFYGHRNRI